MNQKLVVLAALVAVLALGVVMAQSPPKKPVWPKAFDCIFGMNYQRPPMKITNETSYFYYDFNIISQLIVYPTNCIPFAVPNSIKYPCKLYFNADGIYFSQPANNLPCCSLFPGVGPVPPAFLAGFNYSNVENANDYSGVAHKCNHWVGDGGFGYWTDINTGSDIQFKDGPTGVFWNFAPLNVRAQNASIFDLPSACTLPCPAVAQAILAENDPMIRLALAAHGRL